MSSTLAATLVFASIFFSIIFLYLYIVVFRATARSAHDQGKLIFLYDSKERQIRLDNSPLNKAINKYIYQDTYKKGKKNFKWNDFTSLSNKFSGTSGGPAIRTLINNLNTHGKKQVTDFKVTDFGWAKKKTFNFEITGVQLTRENMFSIVVKWEPIMEMNYKKASIAETPPTEISNIGANNYGFISFNTNIKVKNAQYKFINAYIKLAKDKQLIYFIKRNTVVLVVSGKKAQHVSKKIRRIKNLITTRGLDVSLSHYYNATSFVETRSASSVQKISRVFQLLEYLNYLSLTTKVQFVTMKSKVFNKEESIEYMESASEFRSSLKTGNLKAETISVKKRSNRRHIVHYVKPLVNGVSIKMTNKILTNKTNLTYLTDAFSTMVSKNQSGKPVLIDVNDYWLIKAGGTIENKRSIYIININSWTDSMALIAVIQNLKNQGFYFALRIKKFNEEISSLIKNIEPQFIVIDESLAKNPYDSDAYISILSINKLADEDEIKVIFENPIDYYDHMREEQIGLVYYYTFE